ncbi:MAG TPA: ATP-binding cassette domain-containing protein [candidate division Zixibacteria bacterium]|nr:ATP-binding cassette domain-containing protein [candidate division Zixibacteria bacterium]HEQ97827.1 ATP-binding cassette domain-containing protein [candidate division Zixibacteria bacterium]
MISLRNVAYQVEPDDEAPVKILTDINLEIAGGEKLAVMGANGSGKTTIARLIAGLLYPTSGEVRVGGHLTSEDGFRQNLGRRAGFLFQNPDHQIVSVNVERELALGLENYGYDGRDISTRVEDYIKKYRLENVLKTPPHKLSGGEKRKLGLGSVMILEPNILILDEPMAHLDKIGKDIFKNELSKLLEDEAMTLIYITQSIEEVTGLDRLIIMDGGGIARACTISEGLNDRDALIRYGIGYPLWMDIENQDAIKRARLEAATEAREEIRSADAHTGVTLECREISFGWKGQKEIIEELNLDLGKGKIHGLLGRTGCGKTTLALILAGLVKPDQGRIKLNGSKASLKDLIRSVAYIFQNPERGMFAETVFDDIAYGPKNFGYKGAMLDDAVRRSLEMVGLDFDRFKDRSPHTLSGGEARLAAIAGGLAVEKDIVIMDEPTEELDFKGQNRIKQIVKQLARDGKSVLLISHDSDFLFEVCDYLSLCLNLSAQCFNKFELYDKPDLFPESQVEVPKILEFAYNLGLSSEFRSAGIDTFEDLNFLMPRENDSGLI